MDVLSMQLRARRINENLAAAMGKMPPVFLGQAKDNPQWNIAQAMKDTEAMQQELQKLAASQVEADSYAYAVTGQGE